MAFDGKDLAGRRFVLVAPELLDPGAPLLEGAFERFAERGRVARLAKARPAETPEAAWLGLPPEGAALRQGPLTVAALGADPPTRSTHFHLSLLSLDAVVSHAPPPDREELRAVVAAAAKLNTRTLTFVPGYGLDHGLVWEALGELGDRPPGEVVGSSPRGFLPEGDGEPILRRYIDDSTNLLGELELNRRRLDRGVAPLNLLWPWGHGVRVPVPNLALRRGQPATVFGGGFRLAGLARLCGYRPGGARDRPPGALGEGVRVELEGVRRAAGPASSVVAALGAVAELRGAGMLDEAAYVIRRVRDELLEPLFSEAEGLRFLLAAPSASGGLALFVGPEVEPSGVPFDERALEEPRAAEVELAEAVAATLTPDD